MGSAVRVSDQPERAPAAGSAIEVSEPALARVGTDKKADGLQCLERTDHAHQRSDHPGGPTAPLRRRVGGPEQAAKAP